MTTKPERQAPPLDYERDPRAITRQSLAMIADEVDVASVPADLADVALRLVHAGAQPDLVGALRWSPDAGARGRAALAAGAPILVDAAMVADGIARSRLPAANTVMCTAGLGTVASLARRRATTRSAAAVELWPPWLAGAVVAIGNAPTALFRLLDGLAAGWPRPALILGFPVGYVGAAAAKAALGERAGDVPYVTLAGRFGGSALAAAAVNALARSAP